MIATIRSPIFVSSFLYLVAWLVCFFLWFLLSLSALVSHHFHILFPRSAFFLPNLLGQRSVRNGICIHHHHYRGFVSLSLLSVDFIEDKKKETATQAGEEHHCHYTTVSWSAHLLSLSFFLSSGTYSCRKRKKEINIQRTGAVTEKRTDKNS